MNNFNFFDSRPVTLGNNPNYDPEMSINSDLSLGTKKVLNYNSSSMKFFPKEDITNLDIKINLSENVSVLSDRTPKKQNSVSPKRPAIRNRGKSGTTYFFPSVVNNEGNELNDDNGPARTEHKKKTIKFGEKDEVKFFTMKEMSSKASKHENYEHRNSRLSISSKNHSSNSKSQKASNSNTNTQKDESERVDSNTGMAIYKKKDGNANFGKSITVIMLINHFLKQMKLKSGKFGRLGVKQCKILNDLGHNDADNEKDTELFEFEPNLMARMIVIFY